MIATAATTVLPISSIATGVGLFLAGQVIEALRHIPLTQRQSDAGQSARQAATTVEAETRQQPDTPDGSPDMQPSLATASPSRYYRKQERDRIVATLRADSSILAVGKEGMGKSVGCVAKTI